ncbi:ribonuclease D [Thalassotalea castellviae]|uniref:Ribonuclease D n=1 Tax=Thalassotalea castellviae TaxID=3075612 RepID=A0ABU3A337_9GAMM|nr:ribonuclease D [Thalassotalea sp. W431]MDT0604564.1 ribonuclease D [Thalassotalea sp. W431]
MQNQYIEDDESLVSLCHQLSQANVLTIDTEFVRTRTLYPRLGLLQVCDGKVVALIDPIAINDLSPFWALMTDANIEKVLHACSEDLEVFLTQANCRPNNLIDSQIMMSFLGHGLSIGYAAMVKHYLDIELDKSDSRTDWTKRPLTASQIEYAGADVEYLYQVYPLLKKELMQTPWLEAAQQETQLMIERKFTPIDDSQLYLNVKMSWRLNAKQLNTLKFLSQWRYQQAKKRDLPISFVAKDHTIIGVAQTLPKNVGVMANIEGVDVLDVRHKGKAMLAVLKQAEQVDETHYPEKIKRLDEYPGYKQTFKKIKSFIASIAKQHQQQVEVFASKKQINQFLSWHYQLNTDTTPADKIDVLRDWRLNIFGEKLLAEAKSNFSQL